MFYIYIFLEEPCPPYRMYTITVYNLSSNMWNQPCLHKKITKNHLPPKIVDALTNFNFKAQKLYLGAKKPEKTGIFIVLITSSVFGCCVIKVSWVLIFQGVLCPITEAVSFRNALAVV